MPDVSMTTSNVLHLLRLEEGQGQLTRASVSETLEKCGARFRGALGSPLDGLLTPEMAGGASGWAGTGGGGSPCSQEDGPPAPAWLCSWLPTGPREPLPLPSDLLGKESRLPKSPWQLSKPRCRVTGPPWLQLSKPDRPTWGLGGPWPRLLLPHAPGSGSCHLVPASQCVPPARATWSMPAVPVTAFLKTQLWPLPPSRPSPGRGRGLPQSLRAGCLP